MRRIRATHRYGFRVGEWATIIGEGTQRVPGAPEWRAVYVVQFDDGVIDTWPVNDPSDPYEFS